MSKKSRFWRSFDKHHVKGIQRLLKSDPQNLRHIYWSMWRQLSSKETLLVICQVLRLLVNTLTADDKYSLLNRDNLMQPIHMQLSLKAKTFSRFFSAFLTSRLNFEHFQKKMTLIADVFSKLRTQKPWLDQCLKIPVSEVPSKKQHGKRTQTLFKSELQHL